MGARRLDDRDWEHPRNQRRFTPIAPLSPMEENRIPVVKRRTLEVDEAEMLSTIRTMRTFLPESVGALKYQNKQIIAKLDELLAGIRTIQTRLDRLEDAK
jgi:hypothetical protein